MEKIARIAFISFRLESNYHAPTIGRSAFFPDNYYAGSELEAQLHNSACSIPKEFIGFSDTMDLLRPWDRIPILVAKAKPAGCLEQNFFEELKMDMSYRLDKALPVDAVFFAAHGAATTTEDFDPDGTLFSMVRDIVGSETPIVAVVDLHANINGKMVGATDMICGYLTNPHVDQYERGRECAIAINEMLKGQKTAKALVKLPIIPPSTSLNTKFGPYADLISFGKEQMSEKVMNITICSGFTLGDSPKGGMSVVVTTRDDRKLAEHLAGIIAEYAWSERHRYTTHLISIKDAVTIMKDLCQNPQLPSVLFADPADNPGGGGRGNTTYILNAMIREGVKDALIGCLFDAPLVNKALQHKAGSTFLAEFNSQEDNRFSEPISCRAKILAFHDGNIIARRGILEGEKVTMGPSVLLEINNIKVIVISRRIQCCEPMMIECFGVDIRSLRSLIVKSRGHFRAGFDDIFNDDQIIEIDAPGLTTPVVTRIPFLNIPRPIYPLDPDMEWEIEIQSEFQPETY